MVIGFYIGENMINPFKNHILETAFFSQAECQELVRKILAARSDWLQRPGYFTIGAASYIDKANNAKLADLHNAILLKHFTQGFYDQLKQRLEEKFSGHQFQYLKNVPLPGFHIFPGKHTEFPFHIDTNHVFVEWPKPLKLDFSKVGSLTFSLQLPNVGGGIYFWPEWSVDRMPPEKINAFFAQSSLSQGTFAPLTGREEVRYHEGCLYTFGQVLHQVNVDAQRAADKNEFRISLQAHAVWHRDGYWILYW